MPKADGGASRSRGRSGWGLMAVVLVLGAIFGVPPLARYLKAPPISEDFGIEGAVAALRLEARGIPYLVLVDENGRTHSARLEERGFEQSQIAWSEAGLSTGGPEHDYLLGENGLREIALSSPKDHLTERARFATESGFAVLMGSAEGQEAAFVDASSGDLTLIDIGYVNPAWASCGDEVVSVREGSVETVTPDTVDFDGLGLFDGVESLACDADRAYGLGQVSDESPSRQVLRVWDRATGRSGAFELRYPDGMSGWRSGTPFVHEGRLYWALDGRVWSVRPPESGGGDALGEGDLPVVEVEPVSELAGRFDEHSPVVGTDEGILAVEGGRLYGVALDEDWIEQRKGRSYDRLDGMAIFSVDASSGERRIEIEVDDIDFPKRDLHVTAIAVDPEWAAAR